MPYPRDAVVLHDVDGLVLDEARPEDLATLASIELNASKLIPSSDLPIKIAEEPTPLGVLRRAQERRRLWVARLRGSVVGFVLCSYKDGLPYVRELDVLPTHGRRGIGTALLLRAIQWARGLDAPHLVLTTFRHLPFNAPFYAHHGFREIPLQEQGVELRAQLISEARRGIAPENRVAMRLPL